MPKDAGLRIRVEKDLRATFVQVCKNQGKSASDVLREYMQAYVDYDSAKRQPDLFSAETANK